MRNTLSRRGIATSLLAAALAVPGPARAGEAPVLYARHCAACHGRAGAGNGPAARDLRPPPRDFTRGQFRFRSTASGSLPAAPDLEESIRHGLPGTAMPAYEGLLSADEIEALARHILSIAPEGMRDNEPVPVSFKAPASPSVSLQAGATPQESGRAVYLFLQCWTCHGLEGNGRGVSSTGLTDESGSPIRPTDFRYAPFKGGRDVERVMRDLLTGLSGTPMPSYADVLLYAREDVEDLSGLTGSLTPAELESLARAVAASPARAEIDGKSEAARLEMRDERAAALARYVLSFDRRRGFAFRFFRERPELEPRVRQPLDASELLDPRDPLDPRGDGQ